MQIITLAGITFPIIIILDYIWIQIIAKSFYATQLAAFMGPKPFIPAAIVFYLIYSVAIAYFIVTPALGSNSIMYAIAIGAFFGFVAYSTWDLTNMTIMANWPLVLTIVDIAWGAFVTATSASLTYLIATRFLGM